MVKGKDRAAWGLALVLAVVVLAGALLLARASGWHLTLLPRSEWGVGRGGVAPEGNHVVLDPDKLRLGLFGVQRLPFVRRHHTR